MTTRNKQFLLLRMFWQLPKILFNKRKLWIINVTPLGEIKPVVGLLRKWVERRVKVVGGKVI